MRNNNLKFVTICLIALFSLANSAGLRGKLKNDVDDCYLSCWQIPDKVLPGDNIGFSSAYDSIQFNDWIVTRGINQCCNDIRVYNFLSGYVVPDNVNVTQVNEPDFNDVSVKIVNATNSSSLYRVDIVNEFQKFALNLTTQAPQLQANITFASEIDPDLDHCDQVDYDWLTVYNFIGEKIFTQQVLGAFQNITITFYTNATYTPEYVAQTYSNYIQNYNLSSIQNAFPDSHVVSIGTYVKGGVDLFSCSNWQDYLQKLNPSNYRFTHLNLVAKNEQTYATIDSYHAFDQYSSAIRACALQQWNIKFNNTVIPSEY